MSRINLILADTDEWYIENLSKFTRNNYSTKLIVNVFTRQEALEGFINKRPSKTDILLINPEMLSEDIQDNYSGVIILLLNDSYREKFSKFLCAYKYQPVEKLLNEVIDLYSKVSLNARNLMKGNKKTNIISVFSPQGGSGKTVISINLSMQLAAMGMKVLYLNLETINSTNFFMDSLDNENSLSNILFYLKENESVLSTKINAAKAFDNQLNINYFGPADCSLELDELTANDITRFLCELKEFGHFDVIVVDTHSTLNMRNIALLDNSDSILMVLVQDLLGQHKVDVFYKELKKIASQRQQEFFSKVTPIINKFIPDANIPDICVNGQNISIKIPQLDDIYCHNGQRYVFNKNSIMGRYLREISKSVISDN